MEFAPEFTSRVFARLNISVKSGPDSCTEKGWMSLHERRVARVLLNLQIKWNSVTVQNLNKICKNTNTHRLDKLQQTLCEESKTFFSKWLAYEIRIFFFTCLKSVFVILIFIHVKWGKACRPAHFKYLWWKVNLKFLCSIQ